MNYIFEELALLHSAYNRIADSDSYGWLSPYLQKLEHLADSLLLLELLEVGTFPNLRKSSP